MSCRLHLLFQLFNELVEFRLRQLRSRRIPGFFLCQGQLALLNAKYKGVIKAIDVHREDDVPREKRGRIRSPRTGALMIIVQDPDDPSVEFDVCPECGGCFFDSGELAELTEMVQERGIEDIVLWPVAETLSGSLALNTQIRRLALKNFRPLGYPTISFAGGDPALESTAAAQALAKYAGRVNCCSV